MKVFFRNSLLKKVIFTVPVLSAAEKRCTVMALPVFFDFILALTSGFVTSSAKSAFPSPEKSRTSRISPRFTYILGKKFKRSYTVYISSFAKSFALVLLMPFNCVTGIFKISAFIMLSLLFSVFCILLQY